MTRKTLSDKLKDTIKKEFNYKCAICGKDNPHIHHIDEDHDNNIIDNLLPLCPNCHLTDQHSPTRKIEIPKLKLFRKYKDPTILKSQFHPLYTRSIFLDEIEINNEGVEQLEIYVKEFVEFVDVLNMGKFYSKRFNELLKQRPHTYIRSLSGGRDYEYERQRKIHNEEYRKQLIKNKEKTQDLIIELFRYQKWNNE